MPAGVTDRRPLVAAALVLVVFGWAYLDTWLDLGRTWSGDAQYSHGYLVAPLALGILYHRRRLVAGEPLDPSPWGFLFLAVGAAMRLAGGYYYIGTLEEYSIFPTLAGVAVCLGGWPALKWSWPAIGFLWFMIPLHGRVAGLLSEHLQRLATVVSAHLIETAGFPAQTEGNVILLSDVDMGIVEACNGLRMMMTFFALSCAVAVFITAPVWKKVLLIAGAIPVAVACNVIRISSTGILHETAGPEVADRVFHDLAGWLMMPLGLGLLWLEVAFLNRLFVIEPDRRAAAGHPR
jgi:exosortase